MKGISMLLLTVLALTSSSARLSGRDKRDYPSHCTRVSKNTDYLANFRFVYPAVYIEEGQRELFQSLQCTNPPTVCEAETIACDWAAPPLVQFDLEDGYVFVRRQDPANRFLGRAVVTTYQKCNHNIPQYQMNYTSVPTVIKMH